MTTEPEDKVKVKIKAARCMCGSCQEMGYIYHQDYNGDWCLATEVIGSWDVWSTLVNAIRKSSKYEIVEDDATYVKNEDET